jgi:hypothetical protein
LALEELDHLIDIIHDVGKLPMSIDWGQIQEFQFTCLKTASTGSESRI